MKHTVYVPPPTLRARVGNTNEVAECLMVGSRTASSIRNFLASAGYGLDTFAKILDFACGCARTANFLMAHIESRRFAGTDCDSDLIAWCLRAFPDSDFRVNGVDPPTAFEAESFDLIYSISFFTHLNEHRQRVWLDEFHRVLRKGGLLFLTLHGESLALRNRIRMGPGGFAFFVYGPEFNKHVSYQTREHLSSMVEGEWQLLKFEDSGLIDHQDIALLAKPPVRSPAPALPSLSLPDGLRAVYEQRDDLQRHFAPSGLGRQDSSWRNLSLLDWARSYGCQEDPSLANLSFDNSFHLKITG